MEATQRTSHPTLPCATPSRTETAGRADGRPGSSCQRAPWALNLDLIFLVGSPRSGTTWLQALLASHPDIYSGPETQFFGAYAPVEKEYLREKDGRCGISEYLSPERFYALLGETFWAVVSALPEPSRQPVYFLEKSAYHCAFGPSILRVFPRARFIHLIRDARSVVASMLRVSQSWAANWAPKTVQQATRFWYECVQAGCGISELVSSPDQYVGIRYEDVRANPERYLTELFEWLGLPVDDATIRDALAANALDGRHAASPQGHARAAVERLPAEQLFPSIAFPGPNSRLPRYPDAFVGPAPARGQEADLSPADRRYVETVAADVLRELGYDVGEKGGTLV